MGWRWALLLVMCIFVYVRWKQYREKDIISVDETDLFYGLDIAASSSGE